MSSRSRRQFTDQQTTEIVKSHLPDKVAVSELCEAHPEERSRLWFTEGTRQVKKELGASVDVTEALTEKESVSRVHATKLKFDC